MTLEQKQCLLRYLGYYTGAIDGADGPQTMAAVKAFQQAEGLECDGIAGPQTMAKLPEAVFLGHYAPVDDPGSGADKQDSGTVWDGIEFFSRPEFKCQCGGKFCDGYPAEIDMNMVKIADKIRNRIGKPITINSGLRCKTHNANVGGVSNSQHLSGKAADLGCPSGCTPAQMASIAEDIMGDTGGIGIYSWGIHIDTRSTKSRWNG